uniref:NAD-dependent epimerase/dehydratase family protein n=1 Tax=Ornithobacterium rhinotracheale TaxID=28251 RepID=UPI0039A64DE4
MNILITGVNGFIGSNLEEHWKGIHNIYGIDLDNNGQSNRFNWSELDKIPDCDVIIHLAGIAQDKKNAAEETYFKINTDLTKKIFDFFLASNCKTFIFFSSVKAIADATKETPLTEDFPPHPIGPYGKSKYLAEKYIQKKSSEAVDKRTFILRPAMIYGKGNNGNLKLLYNIVKLGIPWPLGKLNSHRSFCYIENLIYIIDNLLKNKEVGSNTFNICDDAPISTNELIHTMNKVLGKKSKILNVPYTFLKMASNIGTFLKLPLNNETMQRFDSSFVVSNNKIKEALKIEKLPYSSEEGLIKTLKQID